MKKLNWLYPGTNTKVYKTIAETTLFLAQFRRLTEDLIDNSLILFVIPPFTSLGFASRITSGSRIRLGVQSTCWKDQGQFAGGAPPVILKEVGANVAKIGHSERCYAFRENDFDQKRKTAETAQSGFTSLLYIREIPTRGEHGLSGETLSAQLKVGPHSITTEQAE